MHSQRFSRCGQSVAINELLIDLGRFGYVFRVLIDPSQSSKRQSTEVRLLLTQRFKLRNGFRAPVELVQAQAGVVGGNLARRPGVMTGDDRLEFLQGFFILLSRGCKRDGSWCTGRCGIASFSDRCMVG